VALRGQVLATAKVGDPAREVAGVTAADVHAVIRKGMAASRRVIWLDDLRLPIRAGARVGEVRFYDGADLVARAPLVAAHPVGP
jgi:hypothetical protein